MPNVVGQPAATATTTLQHDGLTIGATSLRTNAQKAGTVLATDPEAGKNVKKGDTVALVISSGPTAQTVAVPNVVGQSLTDAEALLQAANLGFKVQLVQSNQPANTVLSQSPAAHAKTKTGTVVTLTASNPGNTATVPNVTGDTPAQAGSALGAAGLQVGNTSQVCSNSIGNGLVSGSNPGAGTTVSKSTSVALAESTGPCNAVVPNVVGDTQSVAQSALQGQGFTNVTANTTTSCDPATNGTVVSQTPTGGASSQTSSVVTINICAATTPPSTTPTTTPTTTSPTTTPTTTPASTTSTT
jgi:serine/threonine-protein kinase